ncbi:MAG: DUF2617 family protein [Planctomycetes bacterium]|nr:DUF2617 family protein [Planctomycetota bacterium]
MDGELCRPRVRNMVFCMYTRPLHPELFETLASKRVEREDYTLTIRITPSGHVLTWVTPDLYLAEIIAGDDQSLPRMGKLFRHRFQGERTGTLSPRSGIRYQTGSQLEILPEDIFTSLHDELLVDGTKRGLLYHQRPHHRLALCPLDYVTVEAWKGTISINTFHTFPDECAIVKTQSLIERL